MLAIACNRWLLTVAGLAVVGIIGTVLGIVTGWPDAAVGVIVPLLSFLPR